MSEETSQEQMGRRMKDAAEAAGIDPYEVAAALGVRPPTVYRWFKGQSRPANAFVDAFGRLVGKSSGYLWTGVEDLENLLLRWAEVARSEVSGSEALRQIRGDYGGLSEAQRETLDEAAPQMLALLNRLAGGEWEAQEPEAQRATLQRLLDLLKEWRRQNGQR